MKQVFSILACVFAKQLPKASVFLFQQRQRQSAAEPTAYLKFKVKNGTRLIRPSGKRLVFFFLNKYKCLFFLISKMFIFLNKYKCLLCNVSITYVMACIFRLLPNNTSVAKIFLEC